MKKSEITVGGLYRAKVSGKIVTVRVEAIRPGYNRGIHETTVYDVLNTATGRRTTFRSAAKFRGVATNPLDVQNIPDHPTGLHRSDGIVTGQMTGKHGGIYDITHCVDCKCKMTKPVKTPAALAAAQPKGE